MAELSCAEFHLPSEFLAEEGVLVEKKGGGSNGHGTGGDGGESSFPTDFPYKWMETSDNMSPVGSVPMTESGGEDYMAALTRQMAHYFLRDNGKAAFCNLATDDPKASLTVGSYQSNLNWSASIKEKSDVLSLASSPPCTPLGQQKDESMGQLLMGTRLSEEGGKQQKLAGRGLLCRLTRKPFSPFPETSGKNATTGYYAPSLSQHRSMVDDIQQLKRQQLTELQAAAASRRQNRVKGGGGLAGGGRPTRPPGSPTTPWTQLPPQQAGSGMRAVFLVPTSSRGSCGTGVFLPRRVGSPTEPRKKSALSTVLLPARVMQALNLNLDEFGAPPRLSGGFVLDHDAIVARSNAMLSLRSSHRPQHVPATHHGGEACLPSEWTY